VPKITVQQADKLVYDIDTKEYKTNISPEENRFPILEIYPSDYNQNELKNKKDENWKKIKRTSDFIVFQHIKEYYSVDSPPELIPNSGRSDDKFIVDGKNFQLHAVVMYKQDIHYTVIINLRNDTWIYFNDIGTPEMKEYESYQKALNESKLAGQEYNIKNSGVLYFYKA
jgi:hypothetical protein